MLEGDRYSWEGRKLTRFRHEELQTTLLDVNYAYDVYGLRISKKAGTVEHKYFYDGGNLVSEVVGSTYLRFGYDEKGLLSCLTYNDGTTSTRYFYVRDILLNIIGLKDVLGNLVVRYNYDAWGNMVSITGSGANTIGQANPFRYKGYYYDSETMMYYCQTRYYVPEWCRWLSADSPKYLDVDSPESINLFAYCANNPVMYADRSGHSPEKVWLQLLSGLMIIGGAIAMFIPGGQILGMGLIGAGLGSIVGGEISESLGGSYFAGWAIGGILGIMGGQYIAVSFGGFLTGSMTFGGGSLALVGVGSVGTGTIVSVTGAQLIGAGALALGSIMFVARDRFAKRLKRGMSKNQKEHFKSEIEDMKDHEGRGGADNLLKDILREIAEDILDIYK